MVAPPVGARVEIGICSVPYMAESVAPPVGARVEMIKRFAILLTICLSPLPLGRE